MPPSDSFWSPHHFSGHDDVRLKLDRFTLTVRRQGSDLLISEHRSHSGAADPGEVEPDETARRFAFEYPVDGIVPRPMTPDRPLVVQPLQPLHLAPRARVDFFVGFPVDLEIAAVARKGVERMERVRTERLSDTWFGDQLSGVLCYALKSRARREAFVTDAARDGRAVSKIQIHNESSEPLLCRKFCLRLDHCHLWLDGAALLTSPVRVRFHGRDQMSSVDYSDKPPSEAQSAELISPAAEEPLGGLIRRTFSFAGFSGIAS